MNANKRKSRGWIGKVSANSGGVKKLRLTRRRGGAEATKLIRLSLFVLFALCSLLSLSACGEPEPMAVGLTAWDRVELISQAPEPIETIAVTEGDRVQTGALVLQQETKRFEAMAAQAKAAAAQAQARLAELVRGPRQEEIRQGRAELAGAQGERENAAEQLARVRDLVDEGVLTPARLDEAQAAFETADAAAAAARARLDALLEGTTVEQLAQAQAQLEQAQARVRELEVQLQRLSVEAPRPGRIDALPFEVGERPPKGATVAVLLVGDAPYARVYVPEPYRVRLESGMEVPVQVDGLEQTLRGRVRFVSSDPAFTPFFALTEHDRSRLSYLAEIVLTGERARDLPAGVPVQVDLSGLDHE